MSTSTKVRGRKPRSRKDEITKTEDTESTQQLPQNVESQDAPVITNWSRESNVEPVDDLKVEEETNTFHKKSVSDFDRSEIGALEDKKVSELTVNDLLKVLIKRCENSDPPSPIVSGGCERLLKQINRERIGKPFIKHNNFNHEDSFRSRGFRSRGFRGRGRYGRDRHDGHDRYDGRDRHDGRDERYDAMGDKNDHYDTAPNS